MTSLSIVNNQMIVETPYDAGFVSAFKLGIPATERKFDPKRKIWMVNPTYGNQVAQLIQQYFGEMVLIPQVSAGRPVVETRILEIHYIGQTKDRPGAIERSAFGLDAAGEWSVIFPEPILRSWFLAVDTRPGDSTSLYSRLGISQLASGDELKSAYRRLARQWHPDVCKEPDAVEQFRRIHEAYELLSNPDKRARYDVGLAFEASLGRERAGDPLSLMSLNNSFRSPLRCGLILAEGIETIGRFMVSKISAWEDITNQYGQTLVTSWPMGAKEPVKIWT